MINLRGLVSVVVLAGCLSVQANSIPSVTITDTGGPISVTGTGFSSFSSGMIGNNPEAIWWSGSVSLFNGLGLNSLGIGSNGGIWTEPGSSKVSDVFAVVTMGIMAYGVFISDPTGLPSSVYIPGYGNFTLGSSTPETGLPTQISPNANLLSVTATSAVPDAGSTILLLGFALVFLAVVAKKMTASALRQ